MPSCEVLPGTLPPLELLRKWSSSVPWMSMPSLSSWLPRPGNRPVLTVGYTGVLPTWGNS